MIERAFLAVWPPPEVRAAIEQLARPEQPGVRWVPPERWHVTLRFLGGVEVEEVRDHLEAAELGSVPAPAVSLGPAVSRFGLSVVCLPASGLDELAAHLATATAGLGEPPDPRPFAGHLTLARIRHRGTCGLAGHRIASAFVAHSVELVASRRDSGGATYDRVAAWSLGNP